RLAFERQRTIDRCFKIVGRLQLAATFFHQLEARVRVSEIELPAGPQHSRDGTRPDLQIRQPANGAPSDVDEIERTGREPRGVVNASFHEVCIEPGLAGEAPSCLNGFCREVEADNSRAAPNQAQRIRPDVALKMQDLPSPYVAKLRRFDPVKLIL